MRLDGFQREVLAELGLAAYTLAGAPSPLADALPQMQAARNDTDAFPPLLTALLRAAAAENGRADVVMLCQEFLATNPKPSTQARRTLWPKLRRLRARSA